MKNNVNSLAIGMFVLGAALISVATVIIFGAANFFQQNQMFVSRFYETVNGLDVGAPVKFKGVKIGKVERIAIGAPVNATSATAKKEDSVVVIYSVDLNLLKRRMRDANNKSSDDWVREQIKAGLRSKLMYQSIVTGMLYVELDYLEKPDHNLEIKTIKRAMVIPSVSSGLSELVKSVQDSIASISQIDFKTLFVNANALIVNLNEKITAIDTKKLNDEALVSIADAQKLLKNADVLVENLKGVASQANEFMAGTNTNVATLTADIQKTLKGIDSLVSNLEAMSAPNSPMRFELSRLLRSMNASMNSISNLAEYLQRNPDALLTGKSHHKLGRE